MKRRFTFVALGLSLLSAAASAGTVTFWTSWGASDVVIFKQVVANFEKANPGITVKVVTVPGDATDTSKLTAAVAGGVGPDVYMLDRFTIAQRAQTGLLTPLDDLMDTKALAAQYLPFAWAETQYQGKTYGLPNETDARALFYRKDMLKAAGVDMSALDPKNGPITPQQLEQIALKVDKKDAKGNYTQLGIVPNNGEGSAYTWGYAFGAGMGDSAACTINPTDPKLVSAFNYLKDFYAKMGAKQVKLFNDTYYGSSYSAAQDPFYTAKGRMAMVIGGDWVLGGLKQYAPSLDVGVTYLPSSTKQKFSWSGGWSLVIPTGAKNTKDAAKFIQYFTGQQGQKLFTGQELRLPSYKSLLSDKTLYAANAPYPTQRAFFEQLLSSSKSRPALPVGAQYWDQLGSVMDKVTNLQQDPTPLLAAVKQTVQPVLDRTCQKK